MVAVPPAELFTRAPSNPILTAADWPRRVNTVFNPAACRSGSETVLLCRVEDLRGISHLWVARSHDGITGWQVDPEPLLSPNEEIESERWGFEDPRVVYVEEIDEWVLTCTSYGPMGPAVFMATTDFKEVTRRGIIMPPEDKNATLFSRRIRGEWVLLHRPAAIHSESRGIWLSRSRDLDAWRHPERVMRAREGTWWDSSRLGTGPPPIETPEGWLLIYHGVRNAVNGDVYRVGLALLDLEDPTKVLHRSEDWVLAPETPYERIGDVPNVVFPSGATYDAETDTIHLYYGAADTSVAVAFARLAELLEFLRDCPPDNGSWP